MLNKITQSPKVFLFLLAFITTLIYLPGLTGSFILDDIDNIAPAQIKDFKLDSLKQALTHNHSGKTGRPVAVFSFSLNTYFTGLDPFYFKLTNVFLHLGIGYLIYSFCHNLLAFQSSTKSDKKKITCLFIAGLWLLHPIQVSTVLYAVQRMTQLSALFTILALNYYIICRLKILHNNDISTKHFSVLAIFMILAVFSKENGALIPLYILLIEWCFFRFNFFASAQKRTLFLLLGIFSLLPLLFGSIYLTSHFDLLTQGGYSIRNFTLSQRIMTEAHVLTFYLQNIFLPNLSLMGLFHDDFPISKHLDYATLLNFGFLLSLIFLVFIFKKNHPILSFGIGFFFIGHLLESTIFPLELVFEHRNYLPLLGLMIIVGYLCTLMGKYSNYFMVLILCIFALMTLFRTSIWGDDNLFIQNSYTNHPNSRRCLIQMAGLYLRHGHIDEGRNLLNKAETLSINDAAPTIHLLGTYCASNSQDKIDKLIKLSKKKLTQGIISLYTKKMIYELQENKLLGKCPSISASQFRELTYALISNIKFGNTGKHQFFHGRSLLLSGNFKEAELTLKAASQRSQPEILPGILYTLGIVQLQLHKPHEANQIIAQLKELSNTEHVDTEWQVKDLNSRLSVMLTK